MKNKKGFTLIELLAVIVILAIIALVTVPIIMNMIKTSKKKAAVSAAYGYIDAINYNNELSSMNNDYEGINYEKIDDDTDIPVATINTKVKMKGKKPTGGTVTIENGKVTGANDLEFEGYKVDYNGKTATIDGESNSSNNSESGSGSNSNSSNTTPNNPYLTTFDGEYGYRGVGSGTTYGELDTNWMFYLREDTDSNNVEVCGKFTDGTTCLEYGVWESNNTTCTHNQNQILEDGDDYAVYAATCTDDGYISGKKAEMEAKGATCTFGYQDDRTYGDQDGTYFLECIDDNIYCAITSDEDVDCGDSSYLHYCRLGSTSKLTKCK